MNQRVKHVVFASLPRPVRRIVRRHCSIRKVRRFREDQWPCAPVVRRLVQPGDCVVDAGANIGYLTALLARWAGPQGVVHSIEPVPETYEVLARAVRALGLRQVRLHACAVSDADSEGLMEIPTYRDGAENFYESRVVAGASGRRSVRVALRKLDGLLAGDLDRVAFAKIDVEGHELAALRGAAGLLARSRPALLIEVSGDPDAAGGPASELFALLAALGYGAFVWKDGRLRPRARGDREVDYLFLTDRHLRDRLAGLAAEG